MPVIPTVEKGRSGLLLLIRLFGPTGASSGSHQTGDAVLRNGRVLFGASLLQ